jgi:hypothetical protein
MYNDVFTKGFQILDGSVYTNQFDVTSVNWGYEGGTNNDYHPTNDVEFITAALKTLHAQVETDFVTPYFPNYEVERTRIWEGVNKDVQEWHDHYYTHPNFFFLLYWSDIQKDGEGSVWFTNLSHDIEYEIKPTPGTLIAVNNNGNFLHRVDPSSHVRVLAEFYFDINYDND